MVIVNYTFSFTAEPKYMNYKSPLFTMNYWSPLAVFPNKIPM